MSKTNGQAGATPADGDGATPTPTGSEGGTGGATPKGQEPAPTPPATPNPSSSSDEPLGEAGIRALEAERAAHRTAKEENKSLKARVEELENAGKTEQERAIAEAVKAAKAETQKAADTRIRRAEVKAALTAAGIQSSELDLAVQASDFAELKVSDDGAIEGLQAAVDGFRKAHPGLFTKPAPAGTADGGARGGGSALTLEAIRRMTPEEMDSRWDEVQAFLAAQK